MTTAELHEILDNEERKLTADELKEVVFQLKQDKDYPKLRECPFCGGKADIKHQPIYMDYKDAREAFDKLRKECGLSEGE